MPAVPKGLERIPAKVVVTGNLKLMGSGNDVRFNRSDRRVFLVLKRKADGRACWWRGVHTAGEEEILLDAFRRLKQAFPDFQMVLAPRHPQRFPEVESLLKASGMEFEKKSQTNGRGALLPGHLAFWIPSGIFKNFMRSEILRLWAVALSMPGDTIYWSPPVFADRFYSGPTWPILRRSPRR